MAVLNIKTRCSEEFKKKIKLLAKVRNTTIVGLIKDLLSQEIGWDGIDEEDSDEI